MFISKNECFGGGKFHSIQIGKINDQCMHLIWRVIRKFNYYFLNKTSIISFWRKYTFPLGWFSYELSICKLYFFYEKIISVHWNIGLMLLFSFGFGCILGSVQELLVTLFTGDIFDVQSTVHSKALNLIFSVQSRH